MDQYFITMFNINNALATVVIAVAMFIGLWVLGYYGYMLECWCLHKKWFGRRLSKPSWIADTENDIRTRN